jgi:hypothetical protein
MHGSGHTLSSSFLFSFISLAFNFSALFSALFSFLLSAALALLSASFLALLTSGPAALRFAMPIAWVEFFGQQQALQTGIGLYLSFHLGFGKTCLIRRSWNRGGLYV